MRVLLLQPAPARLGFVTRFTMTEALTGIFLGPVLAPRHEPRLVDQRITPHLDRELGDWTPDAVVIAAHPSTVGGLGELATGLRRRWPGLKLAVVGSADYGSEHVVERPADYTHPAIDALVPTFSLHDLQRIVPALLDRWEAGVEPLDVPGLWLRHAPGDWVATDPHPFTIGDIGVPDRTLLGRARGRYRFGGVHGVAYVVNTWGCPHRCRFCPAGAEHTTLTHRSLGDVLEELAGLSERSVMLADVEPFAQPEAMRRLATSIAASGIRKRFMLLTRADSILNHGELLEQWKAIGLELVLVGLDGHDDRRLAEIGKASTVGLHEAAFARLRSLGLTSLMGMTVPSDARPEDFAAIRATVKRLDPDFAGITVETPLPGTRLFAEREADLTSRDWSLYDLSHALLPTSMPLDDFYSHLTRLTGWLLRRSTRAALAAHGPRDMARNALQAPGALWNLWRAARHHGTTDPARPRRGDVSQPPTNPAMT